MVDINNGGQAVIEDGAIVIRVPFDTLPMILEGAWGLNALDVRYKITDVDAFVKDFVHQLNYEDETGSTVIHRMFDEALDEAINQGAMGIEEHEDQEDQGF